MSTPTVRVLTLSSDNHLLWFTCLFMVSKRGKRFVSSVQMVDLLLLLPSFISFLRVEKRTSKFLVKEFQFGSGGTFNGLLSNPFLNQTDVLLEESVFAEVSGTGTT